MGKLLKNRRPEVAHDDEEGEEKEGKSDESDGID